MPQPGICNAQTVLASDHAAKKGQALETRGGRRHRCMRNKKLRCPRPRSPCPAAGESGSPTYPPRASAAELPSGAPPEERTAKEEIDNTQSHPAERAPSIHGTPAHPAAQTPHTRRERQTCPQDQRSPAGGTEGATTARIRVWGSGNEIAPPVWGG